MDEDGAFEVLSAAGLLLLVGTASVNDLVDRFDDGHFFGGFVIDLLLIEHAFEVHQHAAEEEEWGGDQEENEPHADAAEEVGFFRWASHGRSRRKARRLGP